MVLFCVPGSWWGSKDSDPGLDRGCYWREDPERSTFRKGSQRWCYLVQVCFALDYINIFEAIIHLLKILNIFCTFGIFFHFTHLPCSRLANKYIPGSVKRINAKGSNFQLMENHAAFQKFMKKFGVPDDEIFQTVDLFEARNVKQVVLSLSAMGRLVSSGTFWHLYQNILIRLI